MADMLVTAEELATAMKRDLDRASAEQAIRGATAEVQIAAGQRLVRVVNDVVTLYARFGRTALHLPQLPVVSVSAVTANSLAVNGWTLEVDRLELSTGWFGLPGALTPDWGKVTVTYTHGYAAAGVPEGLKDVVLRLAAERYETENGRAVAAESIDDYRVNYQPDPSGRAPGRLSKAEKAELRATYGTGAVSVVRY